ncbi:hypothetical protein SOCE26_009120 [Sorangium cellulosum]|uniref:PGRS family protein n=1 Tax=Sorangium cellulosum TaxID=56 RepID=A0A2L0EJP8_SORCE|nr:hypothetical protein [Sorangium cellulosum]AUX39519.1 hypothetical protein SOCE26_009120 [Sorangium cellulosum]
MREHKGFTAGAVCVVLAAVGCDALSINLTGDREYMLAQAPHDWLPGEGGGPTNPACKSDPTEDAGAAIDECAVFASATAMPGGDGTKENPYASLGEAIASANGRRVLACASGAFAENVTIEAGIEVIGGFDCNAGWTWSGQARSAIEGPAGAAALTLGDGASGAKVRSFEIRAASATAPGGSSIGVVVADVEAKLSQVDVTAGDGVDGANGAPPTEAPQPGAPGRSGSAACSLPAAVRGGQPGVTTCEDGEARGGAGGLGGIAEMEGGDGRKGADGTPLPEPNPEGSGLGGVGQAGTAMNCRRGEEGGPGAPGGAGTAGSGTTLTLAGITGGEGGNGEAGKPGQGGGGGGGAKAGLFCPAGPDDIVEGPGASGGGGGAGGCGGKGGGGGQAGGSSIGILSLGTKLVLTEVKVAVGKAGKGGAGFDGQNGANGGAGAMGGGASERPPSIPGCTGGNGGRGGAGGPGGGGRGGHAVGVAYAAAPSAATELKDFMAGTAGDGGNPGPGAPMESAGRSGASGVCWNFAENESCGQ